MSPARKAPASETSVMIERLASVTFESLPRWAGPCRAVSCVPHYSRTKGSTGCSYTTERPAEKRQKGLLQGLKPIWSEFCTPGLKPRPPEENRFFASRYIVPLLKTILKTAFCSIRRSSGSKGGGDRLPGQVGDLAGGGRRAMVPGGLQAIEKAEVGWELNGRTIASVCLPSLIPA